MLLRFRDGNIDDIEAVFALNRQVFDEAWSKDVMLASLQIGYDLFVCYQDEQLCGYVLSQDVLLETQIMQIAVDQGFRRQGVAKTLMSMLFKEKKEQNALLLEVRLSNTDAQAFYHSLGFAKLAIRPNYYAKTASKPREDALLMNFDTVIGSENHAKHGVSA